MNKIHPTAIIYPNVTIEDNVEIGPYCIIGAPPESIKYYSKPNDNGVLIKTGTIITGHVTIDSGTTKDTTIGKDNFIMKGVHIGHDCILGDNITIAPHVLIGGFVTIGDYTNFGMGAVVHQRLYIPSKCMIGMNSTITKTTEMFLNGVYAGSPAKFRRLNNRKY